ncbi:MAG TPA: serine hydrolase domain-containing protein [Allosphingosinicella sp.]|nr:serine hydrolase domain-containing protein [Allosphingosinicella sp.]
MRALTTAALLLGAAAPSAAAAPAGGPIAAATPSIDAAAPQLDAIFRRYMDEAHVPGLVYGVVMDGRLVLVRAMGVQDVETKRPVAPDTLFRIASMSKAFTALAILKLRDAGGLSLDAPAETYVPEMRFWHYPTSDSPKITIRDLLSHAAGFVTDDPWGDRQTPMPEADFTRLLQTGVPFQSAPGTAYEYSNLGFAILGRIVTNVSGRPFEDYIQSEIMRPLGMASTGYDYTQAPPERRALGYQWEGSGWRREPDLARGAFGAMGGVQTSARDYARWIAFLLSAWPPRDGPEQGPARRASVRELSQGLDFPQLVPRRGAPAGCMQAATYGKGLRVAIDCTLGLNLNHAGGYPGYGSYMLLFPDRGIGLFAFANRTYAAPAAPVWQAADALEKAGSLPPPRPIPVSAALASAYRATSAVWRAGSLEPARATLAMNVLMDRSAADWARELARLKGEVGDCRTDAPITPTGALTGTFAWPCDRGRIEGQLLLAPTRPPSIQALRLNPVH